MEQSKIDCLVKKAYERYQELKNPNVDKLASQTLQQFHRKIDEWNGESWKDIGFMLRYLYGPKMDSISASGQAKARTENFKYIMKAPDTAKKVAELFRLRKNEELKPGLVHQIKELNFIEHVVNHERLEGVRPILYTNRFLLAIFPEIMTTIADNRQLTQTAKLLGKRIENLPFESLQVQIRGIVEESLQKQNLGDDLTLFSRAALAYHIEAV